MSLRFLLTRDLTGNDSYSDWKRSSECISLGFRKPFTEHVLYKVHFLVRIATIRIATKQYAHSSLAFWVIQEDNKEEKKRPFNNKTTQITVIFFPLNMHYFATNSLLGTYFHVKCLILIGNFTWKLMFHLFFDKGSRFSLDILFLLKVLSFNQKKITCRVHWKSKTHPFLLLVKIIYKYLSLTLWCRR